MKIPFIDVEGTNYEIGCKIGYKLKKNIKNFVKKFLSKESPLGEFKEDEEEMHYSHCKKHFPKYFRELKGIADGSGVNFHKLLYNYRLSYAFKKHKFLDKGCTTIAGKDKNGKFYLGHNEDLYRELQDYMYIVKIKQDKNHSLSLSLISDLPGSICGLNNKGICYSADYLPIKNHYCSIFSSPLSFLLRSILDSSNFKCIEKRITTHKRTMPMNYFIVHSTKGIVSIETSINDFYTTKTKSIYYHTNHFLSKKFKGIKYSLRSLKRYARIKELVGQKKYIDIPFLRKVLADHKNRPLSICNHGTRDDYGRPRGLKTIAAVVIDPSNKSMHIAYGNPCKNKYLKYEL